MFSLQATAKQATLDSREVAEMVGKRHGDLMRDIRTYQDYLAESKIALCDFFHRKGALLREVEFANEGAGMCVS